MKFTTIIPTYRNDGTRVDQAEIDQILFDLALQFGGWTHEGITVGHWVDPKDGTHYQDEGLKISVVCGNDQLSSAEAAVRQIGTQLGQRAMYFEIRDFDGVRFLEIAN